MHLRTAWLATAVAVALATFPAAAQDRGPGLGPGRPDGPPPILHLAKQLGLTQAQQEQIETIEASYREGALGDAMEATHVAREALGRTIHDVAATDDAVTQAAGTVAALETSLAVLRHHMVVEISEVLTAEQKAKLDALAKEHRGRTVPLPRGN